MHKRILFILTGIFLLTGSNAGWAQEVLFTEDFESGVVQNWEIERGWRVEQDRGNFVLGGEGHHWARLQKGQDWRNYTFRSHVKLIRGGIHLNYRVSESGRYFIGIREDGLYLNKETPWGKFFELAVSDMPVEVDAWHIVEIHGEGGNIQVVVDGLLAMEADDNTPLAAGSIAFETIEDSLAFVDNVEAVMRPAPEYAEFHEEHPVWNMPDLAVTDLTVESDRVSPGETVFLRASVSNSGTGITEPVRVVFLVDEIEVGQSVIGPLEPSMHAIVRAAWAADEPGIHRVLARIELEDDIFDKDSRNNHSESVVRVAGKENPPIELEATLVDSDKSRFKPGEPSDITLKVRNPGFADAKDIQLELYIDEEALATERIEQLAAGKERELQIPWNNITPGEHIIELRTKLPEGITKTEYQPVKSWHFNFPDQTHLFHEVEKNKWVSIGPRIIAQKFQGRLHKMALNPKDPNVLFVSTPRGGIWKSTTGGKQTKGKTTWTPLGDKLGTILGGAVAVDPQNPNIVYYATGFSHDPSGVGIYKSVDGGKKWSLFASKQIAGGANNLYVRYTKKKEVLIYAGTNRGVLRYKNSNPSLLQSNTGDWDLIKNGQVRDLAISPADNSLVYASIEHDGLWRTRKGETAINNTSDWEDITNEMPNNLAPVIDIYKSNPKILYASVRHPNPIGRIDLFVTENEGDSWVSVLSKNDNLARGNDVHYNPFIRVHPSREVIYYGGGRLYKSEYRRNRWVETEIYGTHVDLHELVFDIHRPDHYYQLNDGGIWHCLYKRGAKDECSHRNYDLRTTEFYDFDVSQATANLMIGGTQDNGTILFDGSLDWKRIRGGDGYYSLVGTKEKVTSKNKDKLVFYSQDQDLGSTRRTDDGIATNTSHWRPGPKEIQNGYPKGLPSGYTMSSGWITLHSNPKLDKYVLSAGDQVYASTDGGMNWDPKGPNPTAKNVRKNSHIRRVVVQPKTYDWFAGNSNGQVFYTSNPIMGWDVLFEHPYDAEVTSLAFAPGNHKVLYATFKTSEKQAYFRIMRFEFHPLPQAISKSYITDNFPVKHKHPDDKNVMLNVIAGDAHSDLTAYVGTNKGVYRGKTTCDGCTWNWQPYNTGLPLAIVSDLLVVPESKELRAATQGRGAWTVITGP